MRKITFTVTLLFIVFKIAVAQKYSNEFMAIGVGARAHGLGNAVVASVNDVTAGYWNPAALMNLANNQSIQIGAMHANWFAGIANYDYMGVAIPQKNGQKVFAFSFVRMGVDDIPNTLSLFDENGSVNYNNIVPFSSSDYGLMGSYAQSINLKGKPFYIGGNVKVIRRVIGQFANSWGFGIDLGAQYKLNQWTFGILGRDLTTTFNAWKFNFTDKQKAVLGITGNDIPISSVEITKPVFILGACYRKDWKNIGAQAEMNWSVNTDGKRNELIKSNFASISPSMGVEVDYKRKVFLRTGANNFQQIKEFDNAKKWIFQPNFGIGLKLYKLRIDYAYSDLGQVQTAFYSHIISATLDLNYRFIKSLRDAE